MPEAEASDGLSATARVALPNRVSSSDSATTSSTANAITSTIRLRGATSSGPTSIGVCAAKSW